MTDNGSNKSKKKRIFFDFITIESEYKNIWLTVYSDMMTNLTLFFLLLFATTRLTTEQKEEIYKAIQKDYVKENGKLDGTEEKGEEAKKGEEEIKEEGGKSAAQQEEELAEKMRKELEKKGLGGDAQVKLSEQKIRIMLSSPVLFDTGKAVLKESSFRILHEVALMIKPYPNRIVIEGHTDNVPIKTEEFDSNWELSATRAFSVVRYLIQNEGLPAVRLAGLGYGEYRPLVPNDTEENRARNRRIEVNIIRVAH